jgi:tetrapyrrole methylase family protein/MazG family protein
LEKTVASLPAGFDGLIALVKILRGKDGCPWDREQTAGQIKTYLLEEAYEVLEALDSGTHDEVCAELGDLLFHIVFLSRIFEEKGDFNMEDVVNKITAKMIRRHPHVFGRAQVSSSDEVRKRWHEIKMAETNEADPGQGATFDSVPQNLPALMRAYRISERAAKLGFEWPDIEGVLKKLDEALAELKVSINETNSEEEGERLGYLLFVLVNLARLIQVHPETALTSTIMKFTGRLQAVESGQKKRILSSALAEKMDATWE